MDNISALAPFFLADKAQQLKSAVVNWLENVYTPKDAEEKMLTEELKRISVLDLPVVGGMPGVAAASVRRFAKGLDPSLVSSLAGGKVGQYEELYNLYDAYMTKHGLISPKLTNIQRAELLNAMTETLGPSGLRGINALIKAKDKGKIKEYGPIYKSVETDNPHLLFDLDPNTSVSSASYPGGHIVSSGETRRSLTTLGGKAKQNIDLEPNFYNEALAEEISHQTTGAELKHRLRNFYDVQGLPLQLDTIKKMMDNPANASIMTPVDRSILEKYLKTQENLPWKLSYEGPGNIEPNVIEYLESHIRPIFQPRRAKIGVGTNVPNPQGFMEKYRDQKPEYWQMWEREPDIFQKVHELLEIPIPKSIRRKRKLEEFAITPEDQLRIDKYMFDIETARDAYKRHTFGGPTPKISEGNVSQKAIGTGAYSGQSDKLMGFSEKNPKSFFDQGYSYELPVQIQFPGMEPFEDSVKGLNFQHATARALRNWEGASIVPLRSSKPASP